MKKDVNKLCRQHVKLDCLRSRQLRDVYSEVKLKEGRVFHWTKAMLRKVRCLALHIALKYMYFKFQNINLLVTELS